MKNILAVLLLLFVIQCKKETAVTDETAPVMQQDSPTFAAPVSPSPFEIADGHVSGAWFEAYVPAGFEGQASVPSNTATEGFDSFFYTSPDREVKFYIYSPQWTGSPNDIVFPNEKIKAETKTNSDGSVTRSWTLQPNRQNPYFRTFQETKTENTVLITGFYYRNDAAKEKYSADYESFKNSVIQFAD